MQPGMQPFQGDLPRAERPVQPLHQTIPPGFICHPLPGQMPGKISACDKAGQRLLLKDDHRARIEGVGPLPGRQQMLRQDHIRNADAGGKAPGTGGQIHHRPIRPRHALQAGQRAGVKAELRVVVVLNDQPSALPPCSPVQQLGPAGGRHGDSGGELMAGGHITHRRTGVLQRLHRHPLPVHRQAAAGHPVVFQHLFGPRVAGRFHCRRAGQQRGQQPQQILQPCPHHDLMGAAPHAPVLGQILCQRLPQLRVPLGIPRRQQLRAGIQQLLLQPRPGPCREQPSIHPAGGQIQLHRRCRSCQGWLRRHRLRQRRLTKVWLHIKSASGAAF